jgi:argininosuccinate lyase
MNPKGLEPLYAELLREFRDFLLQKGRQHLLGVLKAHLLAKAHIGLPSFGAPAFCSLFDAIDEAARFLNTASGDDEDAYLMLLRRIEQVIPAHVASLVRIGLSRNDLDMTIFIMIARDSILKILDALISLRESILFLARHHMTTLMVAETHYQPAQPTMLAHYLLGWDTMLQRDIARFIGAYARLNHCPLGAAALAGTSLPIDREYLAQILGFDGPHLSTYDAVSGSDWETEIASVAGICAANLTRIVADLINWAVKDAFRLPDSLVEPSTYMPQKRNPAILEHIRALLAAVIGTVNIVSVATHNVPYGDHNDFGAYMQSWLHQQFSSLATSLRLIATCIQKGILVSSVFSREVTRSLVTSSDLVEYLVWNKGVPFEEAELLAKKIAAFHEQRDCSLDNCDPETRLAFQQFGLTIEEVKALLDPVRFIERRCLVGGPGKESMQALFKEAHTVLEEQRRWLAEKKRQVDESAIRLCAEIHHLKEGPCS